MYGNNGIILTMCIEILNVISANEAFKVELFPLKSVVHVGSALELNCRVKGCAGDASFIWMAHGDNSHDGDVESNQTVSRLLFSNILPKHSKSIVCKAQCSGISREKTSVVQVYSFPTDPVLARIKHFKANQVQMLSCTIHNIYPAEKFKIEWVRGDKTLHEEEPEKSDYEDVQNFSSTFNYTPSVTDLGKNISCRATLHLNDFTLDNCTTLEYGPGTITVSSNYSIVQLGKHLEITCHADGNPQPKILWWKTGASNPIAEGQNEKLVINNASSSQEGLYKCEARNEVGSLQMPVQVIVQAPPKKPKIQLENNVDPSEAKNDFGMNKSMINTTVKVPPKIPKTELENSVDPSEAKNYFRMNKSMINTTVPPKIPQTQLENSVDPSEAKHDFGMNKSMINTTVNEQQDISITPDLPTVIVPAVGSVSLLTALAVLIRYLRKTKGNSFNISMN